VPVPGTRKPAFNYCILQILLSTMVNAGSWSVCSGSVVDKKVAAPALVATRGCSTNQRPSYKLFNDSKYNIISSISNQRTECRCRAAYRPENNGACDSSGTPRKINSTAETDVIWTEFVAETLLPTQQGKFRLRGYRHTVGNFSWHVTTLARCPHFFGRSMWNEMYAWACVLRFCGYDVQVDGGLTFTEPSAVISGEVERRKEVSSHHLWLPCFPKNRSIELYGRRNPCLIPLVP